MEQITTQIEEIIEENTRLRRQLNAARLWLRHWRAVARLYQNLCKHYTYQSRRSPVTVGEADLPPQNSSNWRLSTMPENRKGRSAHERPLPSSPGKETSDNFSILPPELKNNWHLFTPQQRGGLMVKHLYGQDHFSELGKRGLQATIDRWFGGNRRAACAWLAAKGLYELDKQYARWGFNYFKDPGPHPAHCSRANT